MGDDSVAGAQARRGRLAEGRRTRRSRVNDPMAGRSEDEAISVHCHTGALNGSGHERPDRVKDKWSEGDGGEDGEWNLSKSAASCNNSFLLPILLKT